MKLFYTFLAFFFSVADAFARAGGGGGGFGGGGGGVGNYVGRNYGESHGIPWWGSFMIFALAILIIIYSMKRYLKKKASKKLLEKISAHDSLWDETEILKHVRKNFIEIQEAWCDKDLGKLQKLLHPKLFPEWQKKITVMDAKDLHDVMENINVGDIEIIDIKNYKDDEKDEFTVGIDVSASDETLDEDGNVVSSREPIFYEFWTFERENNEWLLREINEKRNEPKFLKPNINEEKR